MNTRQIERGAKARIAAHRMGDFEVTLRDAQGVPVPGAQVTLRLVRHDFRLGANGFLIRGGSGHRPTMANGEALIAEYERTFAELLNYATLPFYWGSYEPAADQEQCERLQAMAVWCREHGIRTKGHPLAWHEVFPKWAEALPDGEVLQRLRQRITRLVGGFRGLIDTWDVINEATVSANHANAVGRWVKECGAVACVAETLALAREANPGAELLYNDFNVSPAFEELVGALQAAGAPVDAIGIQSHMHKGAWPVEKVWQTCETYARFGLPLHFTEATILSGRPKGPEDNDWHKRQLDWISTPEGEQRQLEEGKRFYTTLFSHPAVEAVTWWDFSDRQAWQGAPAGLVRNDMSPKPLAEWLREAFGRRWTTCATVTTDAAGTASFRGFFGTYTLRTVTGNGCSLAGSCAFPRRGGRAAEAKVN